MNDREAAGKISALPRKGLSPEEKRRLRARYDAVRKERGSVEPVRLHSEGQVVPLSFEQERFWFMERLEGDDVHHNDALLVRFDGHLDRQAVQASLDEIIRRHEILRSSFHLEDSGLVQRSAPASSRDIPFRDVADLDEQEAERAIEKDVRADVERPLDLDEPSQLRLTLYRTGPDRHVLAVVIHHIVCDLWSFGVFVHELGELYKSFSTDGRSGLEELPVQYSDYALWQRRQMSGRRLDEGLRYWNRALEGVPRLLELPTVGPRPTKQGFRGKRLPFTIDERITRRVKAWSAENGFTLYMVLMAAYNLLLARYSGMRDIVVASPIATRETEEVEGLIGVFLNLIPVRTVLDEDTSFHELVEKVKSGFLGAYEHRHIPFEKIVSEQGARHGGGNQPVAQVSFTLQNTPRRKLSLPGVGLTVEEMPTGRSRFDITMLVTEERDRLVGEIEYRVDLFDDQWITEFSDRFVRVLETVIGDPGRRVWDVPLLSEREWQRIVRDWNDTAVDFGVEATVPALLGAAHEKGPDEVAVRDSDGLEITYRELDERSDRLAGFLLRSGVRKETPVAVCLPRSVLEVVTVLAVMKSGGVYVPLHPEHPVKRSLGILRVSSPSLLLAFDNLHEELRDAVDRVVDPRDAERERAHEGGAPFPDVEPGDLAYILFTSGSTGSPKGVMVEHGAFCNRMLWGQENHPLDSTDRVLRKAPCTFDVSLDELFRALFNGATSVLAPESEAFDPRGTARLIRDAHVTDADFSPTALRELLWAADVRDLESLRRVVSGTESLPRSVERLFFDLLDARLDNLYGPTEASVSCTAWRCSPDDSGSDVPVGAPMANVRVYLLDSHGLPVPVGVTGEIHVAGSGLARGYLGDPELTAERFVLDPFSPVPGARMYRTGDLGRFRRDGNIEFLGRVDDQMNVRGYRVEPAEIEAALSEHPDVDAVKVALSPGQKGGSLVAYVVCRGERPPDPKRMRAFLSDRIPRHMLPSSYVRLDALPLNVNGKLDLGALPTPDVEESPAASFAEPRGHVEEVLADLWREVLGLSSVGAHDDFFELGGDSLKAVQVMVRASKRFGVEVPVVVIFENSTITGLADHFRGSEE